jgi:hypothetical protein
MYALLAGHGMQELQITKMGSGHQVTALGASSFAAAHYGLDLGFLFCILE